MASSASGHLNRRTSAGEGEDAAAGRSPWRRPGFLVSGVVLAGLLITALVLLLLPPTGPDSTTPAPQPAASAPPETPEPSSRPSPSPAQTAAPAAAASTCGLEPGGQSVPAAAPQAQWQLVGTTAVPTDPDGAGPGTTTEDGFASCFSHDPTGALFAGINWWAQGLNGRADQVFEELTADTPERDAGLKQGLDNSAGGIGQIAGYRFVDVDEDRMIVDLAFQTPDGQLVSVPTPMRWEDGDWKYVVSPTGGSGVGQLPDLTGFTPWSGVR